MTKGLPWTPEEEAQLKKLVEAKTPIDVIAATLRKSPMAILVKCQRLGILVTTLEHRTSSTLPLPAELPSVEETLKKLAGALEASSEAGLSKVEVQRLQVVATLARAYKDILSDYLDYRGIEAKLNDMEAKYASLLAATRKKASPNNASQPVSTPMAKCREQ
ncbi:MAG TPA: hypothetical protein VLH35_02680 [Candidatus Acidoferrales bacterium]|nr:hypothetical protein [Candidatus Acidoferrales bacterium]